MWKHKYCILPESQKYILCIMLQISLPSSWSASLLMSPPVIQVVGFVSTSHLARRGALEFFLYFKTFDYIKYKIFNRKYIISCWLQCIQHFMDSPNSGWVSCTQHCRKKRVNVGGWKIQDCRFLNAKNSNLVEKNLII